MGYEESKKHLLSLSYLELQCLCKRYNLPANKTHSQLASSLALLLEASPAMSPMPLAIHKEASTCNQVNNKRGSYSGREDDRLLVNSKQQKGSQTPVDETSKRGIDTSTSISPVSINYERPDCHGHSSPERGNTHILQSQTAVGITTKPTNPELASEHHQSPANIIDQICPPIIQKHPVNGNGLIPTPLSHVEDTTDKGCGPSEKVPANATPVQFFVMSDEGINLVVDLNSTPASWAENFKTEVCIPPPEPGNFSSFISSLVSKDDHSTALQSGNIIIDIHNKGTENIAPSMNSSLASDIGENSRSEPYPADTTTVNSVSSASTVPSTLVGLSVYQEGAPVVSSSCLTADVQNNMTSDMVASALDNEVLPPESGDIAAPLVDSYVQPTSNKDMTSPSKSKVSGKSSYTKNISVADTNNVSAFSSGDVLRSDSNEDSCPKSAGKQTADLHLGAQLARDGDTKPVEAVAVEEDIGCESLSISCQLVRQTVQKLPVTDAQSHASSADRCIAGSLDLTNPTSSSAASDNAINSLTSKYGAESAQSHDSTDKKRKCNAEELEVLESKTPPAYSEPSRNILHSLRSASARQIKPATLPRRSARLVPK